MKNTHDTPETDAETFNAVAMPVPQIGPPYCYEIVVDSDFARKLERERDQAIERERIAIASWDEERQRCLREADRVQAMREAIKEANNSISDILTETVAFACATDNTLNRSSKIAIKLQSFLKP